MLDCFTTPLLSKCHKKIGQEVPALARSSRSGTNIDKLDKKRRIRRGRGSVLTCVNMKKLCRSFRCERCVRV